MSEVELESVEGNEFQLAPNSKENIEELWVSNLLRCFLAEIRAESKVVLLKRRFFFVFLDCLAEMKDKVYNPNNKSQKSTFLQMQ